MQIFNLKWLLFPYLLSELSKAIDEMDKLFHESPTKIVDFIAETRKRLTNGQTDRRRKTLHKLCWLSASRAKNPSSRVDNSATDGREYYDPLH